MLITVQKTKRSKPPHPEYEFAVGSTVRIGDDSETYVIVAIRADDSRGLEEWELAPADAVWQPRT
jgi:hypothetical protein